MFLPVNSVNTLIYSRRCITARADPGCSYSRGAYSSCSFAKTVSSRVRLFIRTSVSIKKLLWYNVSGLEGLRLCHAEVEHWHLMRNVPAYVPRKHKMFIAAVLKQIRLSPTAEPVGERAYVVADAYTKCYSKAVGCLENGLEVSPTFYAFPRLITRKISSFK